MDLPTVCLGITEKSEDSLPAIIVELQWSTTLENARKNVKLAEIIPIRLSVRPRIEPLDEDLTSSPLLQCTKWPAHI